jgi:hypothetical protein
MAGLTSSRFDIRSRATMKSHPRQPTAIDVQNDGCDEEADIFGYCDWFDFVRAGHYQHDLPRTLTWDPAWLIRAANRIGSAFLFDISFPDHILEALKGMGEAICSGSR